MVRGLTTAAGLWVTAAIGLACGTGMYVAATLATAMVLLGLEVINAMIPQLGTTSVEVSFSATSIESVRQVIASMRYDGMDVQTYQIKERRTSQGEFIEHIVLSLCVGVAEGEAWHYRHTARHRIHGQVYGRNDFGCGRINKKG